LSFIEKVANSSLISPDYGVTKQRRLGYRGGYMKIPTAVILIGFGYGFMRFLLGLIKELVLFAVEAWRDVETGQ